jgi:hypothetical protein
MKLTEAMKIIDDGWIRRYKGFRIRFQRREKEAWTTDTFPGPTAKPLTSEISAWELARRFAEAVTHRSETDRTEMVNIHVVDDLGNPVPFYGTGQPRILNPREIDLDNGAVAAEA